MRLIDVGCLPPHIFHHFYEDVARAATALSEPIFIWGQAEPHICIGQAQSASAELAPQSYPVVQRKLGGGAVWLDQNQYCVIAVVPVCKMPVRPADWFATLLAPMRQTFLAFGLEVELQDRDLWLDGRKIAGSGAATIGEAAVLGSSFLLSFPYAHFAKSVAASSDGFRQWLVEALRRSMTTWSEHQIPPQGSEIKLAFVRALSALYGGDVTLSSSAPDERRTAQRDTDEKSDVRMSKRLVPDGIKLNAVTFLTERRFDGMDVRVLTEHGKIVRLACANREISLAEPLVLDARPIASLLTAAGLERPHWWADRVMRTAFTGD